MITIAGGTGRLGSLVIRRLAQRGLEVRVITRDPARAAHLRDLSVEIVAADVRDRAGIRTALQGASTVLSAIHGFAGPGRVSPQSVDRDGNANLIDAAAQTGAEVILMSVVGASAQHPIELFRAKHAAEQRLMASRARWTIVRATAFLELWDDIMTKPIVFGRGENPINFVSVYDVSAVVERVILAPGHRGGIIEVAGPQNLTFNQLAELQQRVRGKTEKVRHIPRAILRAGAPFSRQARAALAMDTIDMTVDPTPRKAANRPLTEPLEALSRR
ncbi:MAG: NAD(P)H-binding protein [Solirubrobacterales bacterium]|nr:NAD(P)H-binding protein [Solirubrobacterales bacterium]